MRLYHRTSVGPDAVMQAAERFFLALGLQATSRAPRALSFAGPLGALNLSVKMEGGHYTFVEVHTDQIGESRLDKNVKKFFVELHRTVDPRHAMGSHY